MSRTRPTLSVVVATTQPWPELRPCLEALTPQLRTTAGELIVADGHGHALPNPLPDRFRDIIVLQEPGASVFRLRALAVSASRGDIIATTEDHCIVKADWCERMLKAHEDHPHASAIAGTVDNGSTDRLIDWANFLQTFGAFIPPLNPSQYERCPTNSNIAYKRQAMPARQLETGWLELHLNPVLFREGHMVLDERIGVAHVQSHGFLGTFKAHFHNGRSTAGLGRLSLSTRQLPFTPLWSTLRTLRGKRNLYKTVLVCLPLLAALSCCHAAGELAGILAGSGRSPEKLR
ncbi:MAG: glycosyltransferase [Nitrospiraceae bacterium]